MRPENKSEEMQKKKNKKLYCNKLHLFCFVSVLILMIFTEGVPISDNQRVAMPKIQKP